MKKFVFTLQKLYDVKCTAEDEERNVLALLLKDRDSLESEIARVVTTYAQQKEEYARECKKGMSGVKVQSYGAYFDYLLREKKRLEELLARCERKVSESQGRLLRILNEKKVLDRIREEQRQEYLKELRRDEDKELEDFMHGHM